MDTRPFEPLRDIADARRATPEGVWPSFHDAILRHVSLHIGDLRPEDDVYIFPVARLTIDLSPQTEAQVKGQSPMRLTLLFRDCESVDILGFTHLAELDDITFAFVPRGYYRDGTTPLPPWIDVALVGFGAAPLARLRCFAVAVVPTLPHEHGDGPPA